MTAGVVSAIHLHPIKSCHRVEVTSASVGAIGLVGDREWQLSTPAGPLTQRTRALLATVQPELIEGGLRISAPGQPTIEVAKPTTADTSTLALTGAVTPAADAGDDAAKWFSALLASADSRSGRDGGAGSGTGSDHDDDVRLVALAPGGSVAIPPGLAVAGPSIAFGDLAPVLVANTASFRWLVERAGEAFTMSRFRPNLVVESDDPFAEDTWGRFRLGEVSFTHGAPWPRCTIPQVDQESGRRGREPAKVLRAHRWCTAAPDVPSGFRPIIENSSIFGVGCVAGPVGSVVSIGDPLVVEELIEPLLPNPALA